MLIKTTLIAAIAAIGLTGAAMAGGSKAPTILDDTALDSVIAGALLSVQNPSGAKSNAPEASTPALIEIGLDIQKLIDATDASQGPPVENDGEELIIRSPSDVSNSTRVTFE